MSEKYYTHLGPNTIQEEYEYNHDKDYPLFISLAGTTKCDNEYEISRGVTSFYTIEYIINGTGYVQENDIICSPHCGDTYVFHPGAEQKFPEFACKNLITKNLFRKKSHIFGIFFNFLLTNC